MSANKTGRRVSRLPQVMERTGKKRTDIYQDIKRGTFPAPIKIGRRAVGWLDDEISNWLEDQIAKRDIGGRRS